MGEGREGDRNRDLGQGIGALPSSTAALSPSGLSPCGSQAEPTAANAEASVNDIPDNDLLGRAVRGCRARQTGKSPRWVGVSDTFGLGSTYSRQLCRRFGVDPDEMIGRR